MVIGIDGSRAFAKERTGTENYSYQLLKHLAQIDQVNKYIVYLRPGNKLDKASQWPKNFEFKLLNYPRFWTQLGLAMQTFRDPIDVLFVPSHTVPLIRRPNLPTVMTVHDLGAEYLPKSHQLKQALYLKFITNTQLKSVTKLIAVSEATKQDLVKRAGIAVKNIKVISEGVDRQVYKPLKKDAVISRLKQYDIDKRKYFLFIGTLQPRKNLLRLIEAFKVFLNQNSDKSVKLVIAGGKGWDYQQIYNRPKELGISENVIFLGRVPDADLPYLYNGAEALVLPSLFEGFGLPLIEAMACGCPVIASNVSSLPEVVADAGLLIDPESTQEIADSMSKIYGNDILRSSLIKKGTLRSIEFDWKKTAIQTIEVLEETVNIVGR